MIIKSQYEIKLGGEPTLSDIIGNFDAEGNESILAQVK